MGQLEWRSFDVARISSAALSAFPYTSPVASSLSSTLTALTDMLDMVDRPFGTLWAESREPSRLAERRRQT